ncbi:MULTISPECIES: hypothetical protein [unclassified Burkholderia]|uniref:hypothetical protein n=1 Tax=unclassified Burkholderia TaxID=2613784 RepID=UPI000F57E9F2|nr:MULTISPECIES: hypothetical protein [unclassified Burkholderia]
MSVFAVLLSESIKPVVWHYLLRFVTSDVNTFMKIREQLTCINDPQFDSGYWGPAYLQMNTEKAEISGMRHPFRLALPERTKGQYRDVNARPLSGFVSIVHGRIPRRFGLSRPVSGARGNPRWRAARPESGPPLR